jgi:superfamily II DNA or RNA helicase
MIVLRDHQNEAIAQLRSSICGGKLRPLLAAPCSMGKTMIAASIMISAAEKGKRSVFFCDRIKLVQQTVETFERLGADFSVLQGDDPRYDPRKLIQIASVQTAVRRKSLVFDLAIVDECHTMYKSLVDVLTRLNNIPIIGLSATPYSKGLGKVWDDLIVTIGPRELIEKRYLCPTDYYVGKTIDLKGVKTKALSTGGSDYDPEALGVAMMDDKFNGDIVENYRTHSKDLTRRAIAFSPSVAHSKLLVQKFIAAGIPALHIDGYMPDEERKYIYSDHRSGKAKVLSCSRLLGVGYDDPSVEILIDAYPTKSTIGFVQRAGRIWRTAEGKTVATYLDHAGNLLKHGFPEDIQPESLDDGEKKFKEKDQLKKDEKEKLTRECPVCSAAFQGRSCACGYQIKSDEPEFKDDGSMLSKATVAHTMQEKSRWMGELLSYSKSKGYSDGYAAHKYKAKFGVWPQGVDRTPRPISKEVKNFITHINIRNSHVRSSKYSR